MYIYIYLSKNLNFIEIMIFSLRYCRSKSFSFQANMAVITLYNKLKSSKTLVRIMDYMNILIKIIVIPENRYFSYYFIKNLYNEII